MQQSQQFAWTTMIVIWWKKRGEAALSLEMMAGGEDAATSCSPVWWPRFTARLT
jgi:hypothetical protein